jgi:hypothetical protein
MSNAVELFAPSLSGQQRCRLLDMHAIMANQKSLNDLGQSLRTESDVFGIELQIVVMDIRQGLYDRLVAGNHRLPDIRQGIVTVILDRLQAVRIFGGAAEYSARRRKDFLSFTGKKPARFRNVNQGFGQRPAIRSRAMVQSLIIGLVQNTQKRLLGLSQFIQQIGQRGLIHAASPLNFNSIVLEKTDWVGARIFSHRILLAAAL